MVVAVLASRGQIVRTHHSWVTESQNSSGVTFSRNYHSWGGVMALDNRPRPA
jgi:hypothetical protein